MSENRLHSEDRRDMHSSLSPAVYSHHARINLVEDIGRLPFPQDMITVTSPRDLGNHPAIKNTLSYSEEVSDQLAVKDGISDDTAEWDIFSKGYGDRHFVPLIAGAIGEDINLHLTSTGKLLSPLSLKDYSKMFRTEWFGDLMNSLALTQPGVLQSSAASIGLIGNITFFTQAFNHGSNPYSLHDDPDTGLAVVSFNKRATTLLRSRIQRQRSVGCPVARTVFTATMDQADFLEAHGHIGENSSGFVRDEHLTASGKVKFVRPEGSTIHDVLKAWGDYVERYADYLIDRHPHLEGVAATYADKVLLLES